MSCSLSVNSFRSSALIVTRPFLKSFSRLQLAAGTPISRSISLWPPNHGQSQWLCSQGRGLVANALTRRLSPALRAGARSFSASGFIVLTSYIDLPPDYKDEEGLPFRQFDLEASEVLTLFGPYMSTKAANTLLRILHGRRVAGTLNDPTLEVNTTMFSKDEKQRALGYLRKMVPVDEINNAGLRSEDELALLEQQTEDGDHPGVPGLGLHRTVDKGGSVYGNSIIDAIRAKNIAKREAKRLQKEEERRKKEEEEAANMTPGELQALAEKRLGTVRKPSAKMQAYIEAATSDMDEPPQMTKWERILPSAVVVFLACGLLLGYATYYRPLKRSDRMFPDIPPAAATVGAVILANLLVFAAWKAPRLWPVLNKYFLVVPATPKAGGVFFAMFSHQQFSHMVVNMAVLWLAGTAFYDDVGRGDFLATYFTTGGMGFLGTLTWAVLRNQLHVTTLGASGAVYGVAAAYFWMHRFEYFKLLGLPPDPFNGVPGLAFIGLFVGTNIAAMFSRNHRWDIVSHMVGLATGMVAGHIIERKKRLKEEKAREKLQIGVVIPAKAVEKKQ